MAAKKGGDSMLSILATWRLLRLNGRDIQAFGIRCQAERIVREAVARRKG